MDIYKTDSPKLTVKIAYSGQNPLYIGEAPAGTGTGKNNWRIRKMTYGVNDNITDVQWASGEAISFTVNWDARATYSYSWTLNSVKHLEKNTEKKRKD